jgi:hypothetical protein
MPISVPRELAEEFPWWSAVQPRDGFEASIDALLPKAESWSKDILNWGDKRGDSATVLYDKSRTIQEIEFNLDVGALSLVFVRKICGVAKEIDCMLLEARSYHLIAPDDQAVLAAINRSQAMSYINDPGATLLSLTPTESEVVHLSEKAKGKKTETK